MVAHTFNPSTRETEAGESLSLRPAWSTEGVPGQPGLHREILSRKQTNKKTQNKQKNKTNKQTKKQTKKKKRRRRRKKYVPNKKQSNSEGLIYIFLYSECQAKLIIIKAKTEWFLNIKP